MRVISTNSPAIRRGARMTTTAKTFLLGTAACVLLAGQALAQDAGATTDAPKKHHHHEATGSDRLDLLERQVQLQAQQMKDQSEQISALKAQLGQGSGQVSSAQFEALQNQVYETQAVVKAASTPQDKKMHFKGITFTFGGFIAMESVWRSNSLESDIGSPGFSSIPFAGPGGTTQSNAIDIGHTREFRFSARQSRISGMAEGDIDPTTHITAYGEFDFLGAAASANSKESNSYTPRVRNLYGTVDWTDIGLKFLFGQSWSLMTLDAKGIQERSELAPPTIDAQYVPGFVWTRNPQLRITKTIGDDITLGLSVENPQTTIGGTAPTGLTIVTVNGSSFTTAGVNNTADAEFNPGIQLSLNQVPDVIGKIAWDPSFLGGAVHLEAVGIGRQFYDRIGTTTANVAGLSTFGNHTTTGGGGGVAGLIKVVPGLLDVQFDTLFGSGIGRYGSGQLSDVTYNANGTLHPLNENMEMVGVTLHATQALDLYVFGGRESDDASSFSAPNQGGYGNPTYVNTGCFSYTSTATCKGNVQTVEQVTAGFWDNVYDGSYGRMRIGLQYSYTYDKAFAGVGGAPHTDDNMVFTSFRYYPFQ